MTYTPEQVYHHWSTRLPHSYEIAFDPLGRKWPYGKDLTEYLSDLCSDDTVIDFGCGTGRFAPAFHPDLYSGIDINESALTLARDNNPYHDFQKAIGWQTAADIVLVIEVLLHVHDDQIYEMAGQLASIAIDRVLVLEIMDPIYRNLESYSGNRSVERYGDLATQNSMTQKVLDTFSVTGTEDVYGTLVEWRHQ